MFSMMKLNIIVDEIKKFLNESAVINSDDFKFKQVVRHPRVFFYNYDNISTEYDVDIINAVITVNWKAGFWVNDMGIENFFINVDSIEGAYVVEMRDKHTDEVMQQTQKNINDVKWKFDVEDDVALITNGTLYIKDISFDFKNNMCTVGFFKRKK
jgi:hypothetical protein